VNARGMAKDTQVCYKPQQMPAALLRQSLSSSDFSGSSRSFSAGGYPSSGSHPGGKAWSNRANRAAPGYKGHIPGFHTDAVSGRSFKGALATLHCERNDHMVRNTHPISGFGGGQRASSETSLHHAGVRVPGYSGHIAGKKSDGVAFVGASTPRVAKDGVLKSVRNAGEADRYVLTPRR